MDEKQSDFNESMSFKVHSGIITSEKKVTRKFYFVRKSDGRLNKLGAVFPIALFYTSIIS